MARRLLLALALTVAVTACGDDDAGDGADETTTTSPSAEDEYGRDTSTTTSTVPDAEAEDAPSESGGTDEGMGDDFVYVADLSGDEEVPGPGDPAGTGRAEIRPGDGELCIDMVTTGLASEVTDAHLHEGAPGASGGPVVPIGPPTATDGDTDTWSGVCVEVDEALAERMAADVAGFYANVHTADHPDGAVRGQLGFATIFDLELS